MRDNLKKQKKKNVFVKLFSYGMNAKRFLFEKKKTKFSLTNSQE